jgi:lipopolysaccharide export system protein LptA
MNLKRIKLHHLFYFILTLLRGNFSAIGWALPSDRDQPANIEADHVEYQQKTGITIYTGHVKVDQGTSHLLADTMTVYQDSHNKKMQKIIAQGNLAQYTTLPKPGGEILHASAKTIQYDPINNQVLLLGDAVVMQEGNSFRGQHIEYDVTKEIVVSAPSANSKTTIVIRPGGLK